MKGLTRREGETDLGWQLRISGVIAAQERLITVLRIENALQRERLAERAEFDLSADDLPALLKRQA